MIPDGGAFLLALLMNVSFASSQLSPTHICTAIISDYFGVTFFATVKKLLPLFLLTVLIACGYYIKVQQSCKVQTTGIFASFKKRNSIS